MKIFEFQDFATIKTILIAYYNGKCFFYLLYFRESLHTFCGLIPTLCLFNKVPFI